MKGICLGLSPHGADRTWRGALRMGRQDHGDFCGLDQGPPLRLCSGSLLRAGQEDPRTSRLPVGIAGQPGRLLLLHRLKKDKKVVLPSCHQAGAQLPFTLALHGFRSGRTCNPPASTALRSSLHAQVPVVDLSSHNTVAGLSWPTFTLTTPSWSPPLASELTSSGCRKIFAFDRHRPTTTWLFSPAEGGSPSLGYLLPSLFSSPRHRKG